MPTKKLTSPFVRGSSDTQREYVFGGGAEIVFTDNKYESGALYTKGYIINTRGGDDIIYGSSQDDELTGGDGDDTIYGGDGDDIINGGNLDGSDSSKGQKPAPTNILVGDGERQADGTITANVNFIDGATVFTGGDDTVFGAAGVTLNSIYGDADDVTMVAGTTFNGGDDTLNGGDGSTNSMFGDADRLDIAAGATFNGGDDTLQAGDGGSNTMVGDVSLLLSGGAGTVNGGGDTLISGTGNDVMIGDFGSSGGFGGTATGGSDTFVFAADNGFDSIADFEVGKDLIDLTAFGSTFNFATLDTDGSTFLDAGDLDAFGVSIITIAGGTTTIINLGLASGGDASGDQVVISGVTGLVEADFIFA